jgi:hypothetical protein
MHVTAERKSGTFRHKDNSAGGHRAITALDYQPAVLLHAKFGWKFRGKTVREKPEVEFGLFCQTNLRRPGKI